ncbi:hypothetical protein ACJIZ3_011827 [Penstemon smallii]|uniref:Uncharacterized protein n=1 Tax=Penstemon smallii TaxID=265156 RepID=A0ABD3ULM0_9LAMI
MSNLGETISLNLNEVDVVHKPSVILESLDIHETRKQPLGSFASQLEEICFTLLHFLKFSYVFR